MPTPAVLLPRALNLWSSPFGLVRAWLGQALLMAMLGCVAFTVHADSRLPEYPRQAIGTIWQGSGTAQVRPAASAHDARRPARPSHSHSRQPRDHHDGSRQSRVQIQIQLPQQTVIEQQRQVIVYPGSAGVSSSRWESGRVYILPPVQPVVYVSDLQEPGRVVPLWGMPPDSFPVSTPAPQPVMTAPPSRSERYDDWNRRERWGSVDQP